MISLQLHNMRGVRLAAVPECWDEMSAAQMLEVAGALFDAKDPALRDVHIAKALCGMTRQELDEMLPEVMTFELIPLTAWVLEGCDRLEAFLPPMLHGDKKFVGPAGRLANLRFTEFDHAERALQHWHESPDDDERLYLFAAVLFRPARPGYDMEADEEGDAREGFNPNLTPRYAALLRQCMCRNAALAVVLWYKACRAYITQSFPGVFNTEEAESVDSGQPQSYHALIRAIAKQGIYGTFADVEQLYLYNALMELEAAAEERRQMEEAIEAAKQGHGA